MLTMEERLNVSAEAFNRIGEAWENLSTWARVFSADPDLVARLGECTAPLLAIADQEQAVWE